MSRKVYKTKELDVLARWGFRYVASVSNNYYATTYYKVRAINDLRESGGSIKDCPSVIMADKTIDWRDTILSSDVKKTVKHLDGIGV